MKERFEITGMSCSACSAHIEKNVRQLKGMQDVNVNLLQNTMTAVYDEKQLNTEEIIKAVSDSGYGAIAEGRDRNTATVQTEKKSDAMKKRLYISVCFLIPLLYISMGHMAGLPLPGFLTGIKNGVTYGMVQLLLTLPIMYINRQFYISGFGALLKRVPNMDSLVAIGSGAAFVYGVVAICQMGYGLGIQDLDWAERYHMDLYFESAGTILTLITVGKYLETRSKGKTTEAIQKLMDLSPKKAWIERGGLLSEIPAEDVQVGDIVILKAGAKAPVDGIVIEGTATCDESALTGESIPVEKREGDLIMSASLSKGGYIKYRATRVGKDTTLSQIIRLVEEASGSKAPIARLADKISAVFVPAVIGIALMAAITWLLLGYGTEFALSIGIAVLVISCPCALGLATPTAIMVGTGKGAENGILFKSAESLEHVESIGTVVLDKTGTITKGKPVVTDIYIPEEENEKEGIEKKQEMMRKVAALEVLSEHPLATAILSYANEQQLTIPRAEDFSAIPGEGMKGKIEGKILLAGNDRMMEKRQISLERVKNAADKWLEEGKTVLYIAEDSTISGVLAIADEIKETSSEAVKELKNMGLEVMMLTGDNERTARAIGKRLGITEVIAGVLPQDKEKEIARLLDQGKRVAMIGDGINDAPALARATVGIAIGSGTDIAMETADIILMGNDMRNIATALQLSRSVMKNIKENLFWAFFYNVLGIPLAAGIFFPAFGIKLSPAFGAAAMGLSSFFVVSNALRLKLFHPVFQKDKLNKAREDHAMKKTIQIEGMMCAHCKAHVEEALNAIDGVEARVDLEAGSATVTMSHQVQEEVLIEAITKAGYQVKK